MDGCFGQKERSEKRNKKRRKIGEKWRMGISKKEPMGKKIKGSPADGVLC